MEKRSEFLGVSGKAWFALCAFGLAGGAMALCALVLLAFGLDIGGIAS